MTAKKNHTGATGLLFVALLLLVSLPMPLRAGDALVGGQYQSAAGQDIQLLVTVGSPAPTTLIVIQNLPPGTVVDSASPAFNQYDAGKGEVKWLLTHVNPGRYTINLRLQHPVVSGRISGDIRYKDPGSGRMITLRVRP